MVNVEQLLSALRRQHESFMPPAVPLCLDACGRPADTSDGAVRCVPCQLRRLDLAARPEVFETQVLVAAAEEHADVVEIASEGFDVHAHVTSLGIFLHERRRLAWRWRGDWPSDDRTLEDILEVRSLERLWGGA